MAAHGGPFITSESTDPRRRLGAQAHHLAARLLRSSVTHSPSARVPVLGAGPRSGAPGHQFVRRRSVDPGLMRCFTSPVSGGTESGGYGRLRCRRQLLAAKHHVQLTPVDRPPIILQHAVGVFRVGVPGPVDGADAALVEVAHETSLPDALVVVPYRAPAEFTHQQRRALLEQVTPVLIP